MLPYSSLVFSHAAFIVCVCVLTVEPRATAVVENYHNQNTPNCPKKFSLSAATAAAAPLQATTKERRKERKKEGKRRRRRME